MAHQESWNREASDSSSCQQQDGLVLCSNNCGFLGSPATMNLCPKCFRELSLKKQGLSADQAAKLEKPLISSKPPQCEKHAETTITPSSPSDTRSTTGEPSNPHINCHCSCIDSSTASSSSSFSSNPSTTATLQKPSITPLNLNISSAAFLSISELFSEKDEKKTPAPSRRQSVNRCLTCRKRTGLLGFKCRCGNVFCSTHRYSDKHSCPYDYKAAAREAIAKANPVVKAQKIQKI